MKTVKFRCAIYEVPDEAKYIAIDSDGEICWFTHKPSIHDGSTSSFYSSSHILGSKWGVLKDAGGITPECIEIP